MIRWRSVIIHNHSCHKLITSINIIIILITRWRNGFPLRLHSLIAADSLTVSGDKELLLWSWQWRWAWWWWSWSWSRWLQRRWTSFNIFPQREGGKFCAGRDESKCEGDEFKAKRNFGPRPFSEKIQYILCAWKHQSLLTPDPYHIHMMVTNKTLSSYDTSWMFSDVLGILGPWSLVSGIWQLHPLIRLLNFFPIGPIAPSTLLIQQPPPPHHRLEQVHRDEVVRGGPPQRPICFWWIAKRDVTPDALCALPREVVCIKCTQFAAFIGKGVCYILHIYGDGILDAFQCNDMFSELQRSGSTWMQCIAIWWWITWTC